MDDIVFWQRMDQFVAEHEVVIDRPKGSQHPRYADYIYPYNYGYLKDTQAMDQGGIDVWVGSQPDAGVTAMLCTVDLVKQDVEMKLLIGCTPEEAQTIHRIHNEGMMSAVLVQRPVSRSRA